MSAVATTTTGGRAVAACPRRARRRARLGHPGHAQPRALRAPVGGRDPARAARATSRAARSRPTATRGPAGRVGVCITTSGPGGAQRRDGARPGVLGLRARAARRRPGMPLRAPRRWATATCTRPATSTGGDRRRRRREPPGRRAWRRSRSRRAGVRDDALRPAAAAAHRDPVRRAREERASGARDRAPVTPAVAEPGAVALTRGRGSAARRGAAGDPRRRRRRRRGGRAARGRGAARCAGRHDVQRQGRVRRGPPAERRRPGCTGRAVHALVGDTRRPAGRRQRARPRPTSGRARCPTARGSCASTSTRPSS